MTIDDLNESLCIHTLALKSILQSRVWLQVPAARFEPLRTEREKIESPAVRIQKLTGWGVGFLRQWVWESLYCKEVDDGNTACVGARHSKCHRLGSFPNHLNLVVWKFSIDDFQIHRPEPKQPIADHPMDGKDWASQQLSRYKTLSRPKPSS